MRDSLPPCGRILCGDPRLARLLETELALLGLSSVSESALPAPSDGIRVILADADQFDCDDCMALAEACGCPLLLFGKSPIELAADTPQVKFLRRPFALTALEKSLRQLLTDTATTLPLGDLPGAVVMTQAQGSSHRVAEPSITIRDGVITVDSLTVTLTPAERAISEYLRARPKATVTREELSELLGGGGNIVDVYVCRLRTKIEKPLGRRMIRTVRGVGYVMEI
jgi:hypothetical protein